MLPFEERERNTRDHVQRAEPQLNEYARPVARSLFNIAQFPKTASGFFSGFPLSLFPSIKIRRFICKKGPRGFRRRSKSGRKRPGEGQRQRGVG